jgi:rSAM/selenodomain-associated transferase 1
MSVEGNGPERVHLILMSRAPVPGRTKTRLSPPLTKEQARDFHVACLKDLLDAALAWRAKRQAGGAETRLHLFITPARSRAAFRGAGVEWPEDVTVHAQLGKSLGQRMEQAMIQVLESPPGPAWAVLVGSDLPLLGAAHLDEALAALRRADVVFGPTIDGGYYLVGVKRPPAGLFEGPRWGTHAVLQETLRAARDQGYRTALISPLPDADTVEDLRLINDHALSGKLPESRSLRFIEEWFQGHTASGGECEAASEPG